MTTTSNSSSGYDTISTAPLPLGQAVRELSGQYFKVLTKPSVSKSFTALAVMQLAEAGKLELDAPLQRYLPWFRVADPLASASITVRHLLNQTSGIPGNSENELKEGFIVDSAPALISVLVQWSTLRLPRWYKKFGQRWQQGGRLKRSFKILRVGLRLVWELILPALLLGLPILSSYIVWRALYFNVPDLVSWLLATLMLLLITGIIRVVLTVRVLRRKNAGIPLVIASSGPDLT